MVLFSLLFLLALRSHSHRFVQSNISSVKNITFFRHGRSVGNAGVKGMVETKNVFGYKDGHLVRAGEQQAVDKVVMLDDIQVSRVADAEVILVSPLVRSMATAIIIWAEAWHSKYGTAPQKMPRVQVMKELIERVQSDSERPGSSKKNDPMTYVDSIAKQWDRKLFQGKAACLSNAVNGTGLHESYLQQSNDTTLCAECGGCHNGKLWQPEPQDGICYSAFLAKFRQRLLEEVPESKVLIVAHNGWSRYAFSPFLPSPIPDAEEDILFNLRVGSRLIHYLNNLGLVEATFHSKGGSGVFQDVKIGTIAPGNMSFTNTKLSATRFAPFLVLPEAQAERRLPEDAKLERILVIMVEWSGMKKTRSLVLSHSGGVSYLFLTSKWGVPDSLTKPHDFQLVRLNDGLASVTRREDRLYGHYLRFDSPAFELKLKAYEQGELKQLESHINRYIKMPAPDPHQ